jgi:signal transduction histidine kinase
MMNIFKRPRSLSTYLIIIVLIAVVPVLIFSTVVVNNFLEAKKEANQRLLQKAADELALAFDREITSTVRTLEALTHVQSLRTNDIKTLHATLARILKTQPTWATILLHDKNIKWLLSARQDFGVDLGKVPEPESIREVIASGKPGVGKIIRTLKVNRIPETYGFAVRVPVKNDAGEVVYVLSAIISTESLQELVSRFSLAPDELARAIVDTHGILGARAREPEKFVGGPASATLIEVLSKKPEGGIERTTTLENVEVYTAYRRAPFSNWYSAVAVPVAAHEAGTHQIQQLIFLVGLLIIGLSTIATVYFSRWMKRSIRLGADSAATLARGEEPSMSPSPILEMEELRTSLVSASQLLRAREKTKNEFLANMSHELRTPLGIVLGLTDMLSQELVKPEDQPKSWEIVKRNGKQLLRLINDILDFSKIEAQQLKIDNISFSLTDLVSSIVEDFTPPAQEKGIQLKLIVDPGTNDIVVTDPVRLKQIIYNLVGNSVKFTHKGSVTVRLQHSTSDLIVVTVEDTGIGISADQHPTLFSDFTQGDSSHTRKYGGTGLGLSLSRKLAGLLGGDVRLVRSQPGEGSFFEVTLPNRVHETHSDSKPERNENSKIEKGDFDGLKILLAEDSSDNVLLMQTYLNNSGAQISVVANGADAVAKAKSQNFDLILMDIQMPGMDGFEATHKIREHGISVPIIALTAHALSEHRSKALQNGFTDFLTKPLKRHHLLNTLEKYLPATMKK